MVFKEVQHVTLDVVRSLPCSCYGGSRCQAAYHAAHGVVHAHLVVKVVKARTDVVAVFGWVIHLTDEDDVGMQVLHLVRSPCPESRRYHLGHVAPESVNALLSPEEQDVGHLVPCVGDGVEVSVAGPVVLAVVQLHGLVPVVLARVVVEVVVASRFRRKFLVVGNVERRLQLASGAIVEIVLRIESVIGIIVGTEVFHAPGLCYRLILSRHVVGHEVHYHLQSGLVGALYEGFEFLHALIHVGSQVGIHVIVVADGVWRTGLTFHYCRVLCGYAVGGVVGLGGMAYHSGVPHVRDTHILEVLQGLLIEVRKLARAVLSQRPVMLPLGVPVAIKASKHLVDDYLIIEH